MEFGAMREHGCRMSSERKNFVGLLIPGAAQLIAAFRAQIS
jgi:hypothetical protein